MAINAQELHGLWNTLRSQVKDRWGQLTDDDLQIPAGDVDQLVGQIQQRTGEGGETIEQFLGELAAREAVHHLPGCGDDRQLPPSGK